MATFDEMEEQTLHQDVANHNENDEKKDVTNQENTKHITDNDLVCGSTKSENTVTFNIKVENDEANQCKTNTENRTNYHLKSKSSTKKVSQGGVKKKKNCRHCQPDPKMMRDAARHTLVESSQKQAETAIDTAVSQERDTNYMDMVYEALQGIEKCYKLDFIDVI